MHACHLTSKQLHIYFLFITGKSSKMSSKIEKKNKKKIIELIITENHGCDPGTRRR
jgi:hypothetical protein